MVFSSGDINIPPSYHQFTLYGSERVCVKRWCSLRETIINHHHHHAWTRCSGQCAYDLSPKKAQKSSQNRIGTTQKRLRYGWGNDLETLKTTATGLSGGHCQLWLVSCLALIVVCDESHASGGVAVGGGGFGQI
jgi:hypothetical protein